MKVRWGGREKVNLQVGWNELKMSRDKLESKVTGYLLLGLRNGLKLNEPSKYYKL